MIPIIVLSAPKASAVTCYGDNCSGKDPQSSGCANDAYTATAANTASFSLQVRYSPTCKTNWTRLVMYTPGPIKCSRNGMMKAIQDTGYTQQAYFESYCANISITRWTPMIYSPVRLVKGTFTDQNGTVTSTGWA